LSLVSGRTSRYRTFEVSDPRILIVADIDHEHVAVKLVEAGDKVADVHLIGDVHHRVSINKREDVGSDGFVVKTVRILQKLEDLASSGCSTVRTEGQETGSKRRGRGIDDADDILSGGRLHAA
jgi:hypothetical protein